MSTPTSRHHLACGLRALGGHAGTGARRLARSAAGSAAAAAVLSGLARTGSAVAALDGRSLVRLVSRTGRPTWTAYAVLLLLAEAAGVGPGWAAVAVARATPAGASTAQVRVLTPPDPAGPAASSAGLDAARYHATLAAFDLPAADVDPTPEQLHALAAIVDTFPRDQHRSAVRVAWCESRLDPAAVHRNRNGSSDFGVFQLNDGGTLQYYAGTVERALDPVTAAGAAWDYVRERGWQPWTCAERMGAV